jgi:hypothetical protein
MRGDNPGVCRHRRRWLARVSVAGRWVRLGLFEFELEAIRVARLAREGEYAKLPAGALRRLAAAMRTTVRELLRRGE